MFMFNLLGFNWGLEDMFGLYFGEIVLQDDSTGYLFALGFSPSNKIFRIDLLYFGLMLGGTDEE